MKICVKHLVQYQAHSKNSVHYCYFHDHDDQTSWNLLFTSQGPSLLAAVFSFIIISVIVDFFPLDFYPEVELLGHIVALFLIF